MSEAANLKERARALFNRAKSEIEAIESNLNLNWEDAKKKFEEHTGEFTQFLDGLKGKLESLDILPEDKKKELLEKYQTVRSNLNESLAETKESFQEQRKKIEEAVTSFQDSLSGSAGDKLKSLKENLDDQVDKLKGRLSGVNVQFAELAEKTKEEMTGRIKSLREKVEAQAQVAEDKIEEVGKEITEEFNQLKSKIFG